MFTINWPPCQYQITDQKQKDLRAYVSAFCNANFLWNEKANEKLDGPGGPNEESHHKSDGFFGPDEKPHNNPGGPDGLNEEQPHTHDGFVEDWHVNVYSHW